jgi:heme/copper-type cytochrome/quinol oxidase subunit 1
VGKIRERNQRQLRKMGVSLWTILQIALCVLFACVLCCFKVILVFCSRRQSMHCFSRMNGLLVLLWRSS